VVGDIIASSVTTHGAEETEQSLIGTDTLLPEEFILLGPFGRGTANGFAVDYAQEDIAEAVDVV